MNTVNIHEAKTQLSKLVDRAAKGESFLIAKAGKPLVKVTALDAPSEPQRLGFLKGEISVPKDFDRMGESEIAALFSAARRAGSGRGHHAGNSGRNPGALSRAGAKGLKVTPYVV